MLEISYTRVVSFKLFYYYTYLVIGLALLGIGCGGVLALGVYGVAVLALRGLLRAAPAAVPDGGAEVPVPGALTGAAREAPVAGA